MNKLVKNTHPTSKYYNLEGLIALEYDKSYYVIWFKLNNPENLKNNQIYIKERPFISSKINKNFVKIISKRELSIPDKNLAINMAQVHATNLTGGMFRPKKLAEKWQSGVTKNFYKDINSKLLIYK